MNIYISHCGSYDYENELYKSIKQSGLTKIHRFFLPHKPNNLDTDAKIDLLNTDLLVAEASFPSTGQGVELAQAEAAGVPVICFYKTGSKPSSSLRFITKDIIEYASIEDFFMKLQAKLN